MSNWLAELSKRIGLEGWSLLQLGRAGDLRLVPAHRLAAMLRAVSDYGILGAATRITALRDPHGVALINERGALSFTDLDMRSNALANAWRRRGLGRDAGVAILARNHRGLLDAVYATAKCGVRIILLNTGFGGAEIAQVVAREDVDLLIHDDEFGEAVADIEPRLGRLRAWSERPGWDTLEALIEQGDTAPPPKSGGRPKIIILTSGTTGIPKGARYSKPYSLITVGGLLDKSRFAPGKSPNAVPRFSIRSGSVTR